MTCRTCKHFDLDAVKSDSGRVMNNRSGRCLWQMPEINLPDSITMPDGGERKVMNPYRYKMQPNSGEHCSAWEQR